MSPGHLSRLGRASVDSQMSQIQTPGTQQSETQIPSSLSDSLSSESSIYEDDTVQGSPIVVTRDGSTPNPDPNPDQYSSFW